MLCFVNGVIPVIMGTPRESLIMVAAKFTYFRWFLATVIEMGDPLVTTS